MFLYIVDDMYTHSDDDDHDHIYRYVYTHQAAFWPNFRHHWCEKKLLLGKVTAAAKRKIYNYSQQYIKHTQIFVIFD